VRVVELGDEEKTAKAYDTVWGCRRYREWWHALVASVVATVLYYGSEMTWAMEHTQNNESTQSRDNGKTPNLESRAITGDAGKSSVTMKSRTPLRIRTSPINRTRNNETFQFFL
jgi:hypothetical protein